MSSKKKKLKSKIFAVFLLCTLVISFIGVLGYIQLNAGPEVSQVGCPVDEGYINKNIVILFDTTEPMIPSQEREIENRITSIISELEVFDRVTFYELRADQHNALRKVSLQLEGQFGTITHFCRHQLSWDNSPSMRKIKTELPRLISQDLQQNIEQDVQNFSPITAGLRYIAADVTGKPYNTRVYVVSDMIEHSGMLSMYRQGWFDNVYSESRQSILSQRPIFPEGTEIEVFLLHRARIQVRNEELQQYWFQMLTGAGAFSSTSLSFNFITGGLQN